MNALTDTYQTEFWVPKGRRGGAWMQADALPAGHDASLYARTWRNVKPGHTHKDKLPHSLRLTAGYALDKGTQIERYCQWARLKGLASVATFRGDHMSNHHAKIFALAPREYDVSEFIGPAPADEYDCYGDWDHDGHPSNTQEGES